MKWNFEWKRLSINKKEGRIKVKNKLFYNFDDEILFQKNLNTCLDALCDRQSLIICE